MKATTSMIQPTQRNRLSFLSHAVLVACSICMAWDPGHRLAYGQTEMQPKHVAKLEYATSAVISPSGEHIAYNLSVPRQPLEDEDGPAWRHLHVVDATGKDRTFIAGHESIGTPQWSADGRYLYYMARRGDDQNTCLYRIPVDGGESTQVLQHDTSLSAFDLHPDGKQVVFLAKPKSASEQQEMADAGFNQEIFEEDWRNTQVWIATVNEDSQPPRALELDGSASLAKWSPSGSELVVVLAPTPSVDDSYMSKRMQIVDASSGSTVQEVDHEGKLGDVKWSPDGAYLAFIGTGDIHDPKEGRLMIASATGDEPPRDLMPDYEAHVTSFAWQSNDRLLWTADEGTLTRVGQVNLDSKVETLAEPSADLLLSRITIDAQGEQAAVLGESSQHPYEVVLLDATSGQTERLTNSNPWLEDIKLAKQETIVWLAEDGLELEGVLVYPLNYVQGRRYPMIMLVHGGPESHEANGWLTSYSRPGQVAAARGFFVFYPNYRGSTGRGVEFSKMGQADAAGKEFSDLVDGIDHLVAEGLIDEEKVGITGGSYGGYASAWGATYYSDRFAASVMFVGISDNVSKVGTTDIPDEMFYVHHLKRLWDDWDYFLDSSPIRYVERNQTPTLILHGKEDPRVHPSQSLELHRHLKVLDQAPVRLVFYEGEGHGNRKAAARFDYNLRLLRWMEHFLLHDAEEAPPYPLDYRQSLGISEDDNRDQ